MKPLLFLILYLCASVFTFTGCSNGKNSIVGKWEWPTDTILGGGKNTIIYEFHQDGTLTVTSNFVCKNPHIDIERISTCDYKYENNTITYSFSTENIEFPKYEYEGLSREEIISRIEFYKKYYADTEEVLSNVKIEDNKLKADMGRMHLEFKRLD